MAMLRVTVFGTEVRLHRSPNPLGPALRRALQSDGPVMILIHGYKFDPTIHGHDPHGQIFGYAPKGNFKIVSWPRHLGFGQGDPSEGLCIAFGWPARGWFWDVYEAALEASKALADLVSQIRAEDPQRSVQLMAHSLGARVALGALPLLHAGDVGRAILLAGAEYETLAMRAVQSPAGRATEFLNVTSRENDFYELMFESLIRKDRWRDRGIGLGLRQPHPNWVDIQIDHPDTCQLLSSLGFPLGQTRKRVCHWSTYNRHGVMRFYAQCLRHPTTMPLCTLRHRLPEQEARYSRLLAVRRMPWLLQSGLRRPS